MDFNEAEQRFRFLEDQRSRGAITPEQYRAELNLLRVTDAQGRLWMPQERTGQWYVHEGGQWRAAQPPMQTLPSPPLLEVVPQPRQQSLPPQPRPRPQPRSQPVRPQPQSRPQPVQPRPQAEKGGGCGKTLLYLVLWAVIWAVIAVVVFLIWGREEPVGMLGIGLAALLSLVVLLATLSSAWSGTVEDVRIEHVRSTDDDGYTEVEDVRFAYVRRANGKIKKMRAMPKWQVGDRLEKRRGEGQIRHYPAQ
jgi:hypothetical protein